MLDRPKIRRKGRRLTLWLGGVIIASTVAVTPAGGQSGLPDSVHHRNNCRLAQQVLVHGQPANKRPWALSYFVRCGAAGGAIVSEVLLRHRADASFNPVLDQLVTAATGLVDGGMAATAFQVASDQSAGEAARVQALRVLYGQVAPLSNVSYERMIGSGETIALNPAGNTVVTLEPLDAGGGHGPIYFGAPLSDAEITSMSEEIQWVADDPATTSAVRHAARHVARQYRIYGLCPRGTPPRDCISRVRAQHDEP